MPIVITFNVFSFYYNDNLIPKKGNIKDFGRNWEFLIFVLNQKWHNLIGLIIPPSCLSSPLNKQFIEYVMKLAQELIEIFCACNSFIKLFYFSCSVSLTPQGLWCKRGQRLYCCRVSWHASYELSRKKSKLSSSEKDPVHCGPKASRIYKIISWEGTQRCHGSPEMGVTIMAGKTYWPPR